MERSECQPIIDVKSFHKNLILNVHSLVKALTVAVGSGLSACRLFFAFSKQILSDMAMAITEGIEWPEYVVFGLVLACSMGIGIYYGLFASKQKSTKEYLMANRQMSSFPVALSMICR
jgi:hypothetical protein